ncbi:MAG: zinc-ribbon domain-containing protein [Coriobacteriia bacterium]|nr:zinc-ribbon domain-containing protein [Coriobacteriia bacterium]
MSKEKKARNNSDLDVITQLAKEYYFSEQEHHPQNVLAWLEAKKLRINTQRQELLNTLGMRVYENLKEEGENDFNPQEIFNRALQLEEQEEVLSQEIEKMRGKEFIHTDVLLEPAKQDDYRTTPSVSAQFLDDDDYPDEELDHKLLQDFEELDKSMVSEIDPLDAQAKLVCPKCESSVKAGDKFCMYCGAVLEKQA